MSTTLLIARQIADAAAYIDDVKNCAPESDRTEGARYVHILHDIAEAMAGSRVGEIYAPDEDVAHADAAHEEECHV